jgi:uncharacterized Zn finger protein (UPF0148 family)
MTTKKWRDTLHMEIAKGGDQLPCPFCKLPRVKRNSYIRCARCGINWLEGEALDKDPRAARQRKLIEDMAATATSKGRKEEHHAR